MTVEVEGWSSSSEARFFAAWSVSMVSEAAMDSVIFHASLIELCELLEVLDLIIMAVEI
jgi:hypothetical protein